MNKIQRILAGYRSQKILVLGDLIVDCFFKGSSTRLSPEAPVPVVALNERAYTLGGAANVALNVKALGATVFFCTVTG
ncbi:MAG TPA: carbohydrate kinase, partial [Chitinophaga sp.]